MEAQKVVELVIGMLGYSVQEIAENKWGYCYFPVGPEDSRFGGGRVWVKVKVNAVENVRIQRDVIVANMQKGVKEHTPVELSYEQSAGGYQRVGEDYPLPVSDSTKIYYHSHRNPVSRLKNYSIAAVAPHVQTGRFSYTVPEDKQAIVEHMHVFVVRSALAPADAFATANINITDGTDTMWPMEARIHAKEKGAQDSLNVGTAIILQEGETISGYTYDGAAGGTCGFIVSAKITEFDAE